MTLLPEASFPDAHSQPFVLSVGSTPTANAAGAETRERLTRDLHGVLELHAGTSIVLSYTKLIVLQETMSCKIFSSVLLV